MTRGVSEERFLVRLSDTDVAGMILAAADAAHPPSVGNGWTRYREAVVAHAVAMGRRLGRRTGLEPLDDAARCSVDDELLDLVRVNAPGRHGWIAALERLRRFLDRYPERGRPDDGGPGIVPEFPQVDVTVPPSPVQAVAAARLTLQRFADGKGPFTPGDAERIVKALDGWWQLAPIRADGPAKGKGPEGEA